MLPFTSSLVTLTLIWVVRGEEWDIYDLVDSLGCKNFAGTLQSTGPMYVLGDDKAGPFTVFAPTDEAFDNLPTDILNIFNYGNWELMHDIITFHITYGNRTLGDFKNEQLLKTWQGEKLRVNVYPAMSGSPPLVTAEGATIVKSAVATNGIVHVIDKVLYNIPRVPVDRYVNEQKSLTTLAMIIQLTGLQETLRNENLTLLAPHDSVFENIKGFMNQTLSNTTILTNLVKSHIVNATRYTSSLKDGTTLINSLGQKIAVKVNGTRMISLNGALVFGRDISVTNGVVHTVKNLLFPV